MGGHSAVSVAARQTCKAIVNLWKPSENPKDECMDLERLARHSG